MKAYCQNCASLQPSSFRLERDAATGAPYEDLCCDTCHFVVATVEGRASPPAPKQAEPEGYKLVPVEPDELWMYRVIRHRQPDLEVGSKAWLDCAKEVLHWHPAMLAAAPTPPEAKA
jgi:hypothetical protein